jgi:tetratricopeptide (TPR) repeat protein
MSIKRLLFLIPVVIAGVIYSPSLGFDFAWLDHAEILGQQLILSDAQDWARAFFMDDANHSAYHRPMYNVMHTLDWMLWGNDASGFHLTNLILHLANVVLVFFVLQKLKIEQWPALAITLLWAVLPVHVPVVALIHAKGDLLSTFFVLGAILIYLSRTKGYSVLSGLLLLLGLLTKEVAIAGAAFLLLYEKHALLENWKKSLPILIPVVAYMALRAVTYGSGGEAEGGYIDRVLTFPLVYGSYFFESLPGIRLGISDTEWVWSAQPTGTLIGRVVMLLAAVGIQVLLWRKVPASRPFVLIFNLFLLPVSQLIPTLHIRADRFLYMASLGWIGIMGFGLKVLLRKDVIVYALAAIIGAWFVFKVVTELPAYEKDAKLFKTTIERSPKNREAHGYLGNIALEEGDNSAAVFHFVRALNSNPKLLSFVDRKTAKANLGTAKLRLQQYREAVQLFEDVAKESASPVDLDFNIGLCYKMMGQPQKAYDHFIRFQRKYPEDIATMEKLSEVYVDLGQRQKAIDEINRILTVKPDHEYKDALKRAVIELQTVQ